MKHLFARLRGNSCDDLGISRNSSCKQWKYQQSSTLTARLREYTEAYTGAPHENMRVNIHEIQVKMMFSLPALVCYLSSSKPKNKKYYKNIKWCVKVDGISYII